MSADEHVDIGRTVSAVPRDTARQSVRSCFTGGVSSAPPSSAAVSARMSALGRRDTKPEVLLRAVLHRRGLRFRVDHPLPFDRRRRADVIFTKQRVAVFVDGCFWHSCPLHATFPKANEVFWREKLRRNVERDRDTDRRLGELGWDVIRIWEHEDVLEAADRVESAVRGHEMGR
jgi:DNA mismatch endonuclease, patch repair protein